jgi:hypothetical protein
MLRKTAGLLLREDQLPVREHVELPVAARLDLGRMLGLGVQLGRETRGPIVVAISDGAVEDSNPSHRETLRPRAVSSSSESRGQALREHEQRPPEPGFARREVHYGEEDALSTQRVADS